MNWLKKLFSSFQWTVGHPTGLGKSTGQWSGDWETLFYIYVYIIYIGEGRWQDAFVLYS